MTADGMLLIAIICTGGGIGLGYMLGYIKGSNAWCKVMHSHSIWTEFYRHYDLEFWRCFECGKTWVEETHRMNEELTP